MQIDALLWIFLPAFIAAGSALLSFYMMQARMEVAISKEREVLAEARAEIRAQKITLEERVKATEQEARRRALDELMQEFRVEERHYFRENKSVAARQKSMILQERLYFRNIPLSSWVEHEMVVEENTGELELSSKVTVARLLEHAAAAGAGAQLSAVLSSVQAG
jgi:hypothetical protein